jgi:hypothetical protein
MPNLGDYIGHLLAEITIARMQADVESVRVAELYSNHPLLKNMPIPHFRLPSVELDIPVAIKEMQEQSNMTPRGAPTLEETRKAFDKTLAKTLIEEKIRLTPEQNKKLTTALNRTIRSLTQPPEVAVDINRIANELANTASKTLAGPTGPVDPKIQDKLETKIKEYARIDFINLRKPISRLQVLVNTSEIREAGPNEVITKIHLKLTEEAFEWTSFESDGKKQDRLIIE